MFAGRFGSISREYDAQPDQKYMDWFGLNLHIFLIKPKPNKTNKKYMDLFEFAHFFIKPKLNQTEKQHGGLCWIDRMHYTQICKNIFKKCLIYIN